MFSDSCFAEGMRRRSISWFGAMAVAVLLVIPAASFVVLPASLSAQDATPSVMHSGNHGSNANYRLAARFAPYKMQELIYSTSVSPRWIEGGERFWYEWETSDGKFFSSSIRVRAPNGYCSTEIGLPPS